MDAARQEGEASLTNLSDSIINAEAVISITDGLGLLKPITTVYLDASDLLFYFRHHLQVSGIQRVQVELLAYLLRFEGSSFNYVMTFRRSATDPILAVPGDAAMMLMDYFQSGRITRDRLHAVVNRMGDVSSVANIGDTHCYFLLGAFWVFPDTPKLLSELAASGARIGALIYDLIPVRHREFCESGLSNDFTSAILGVGACLSLAFTISDYVARDYAAFREEKGQPEIPISSLPLAVELDSRSLERQPNADLLRKIGPSFALQVGTVEVRKNPRFALEIWRQLIAEGMPNLPKLVYVGRIGWRITDFLAELESTNYLDGNVIIISGVGDADLAALYSRAQFTIFPSFAEGWGLPVGESLAHGIPCVTSRTTSLPEVAGEFGDYVDPLNIRSGVEAVRRLLDPDHREAQARRIREHFPLRSWATVGRMFAERLDRALSTARPVSITIAPTPDGEMIFLGRLPGESSGAPREQIKATGWSVAEDWGMWAIKPQARLRFRVALSRPARILLVLRTPPWFDDHQVEILDADGRCLAARRIVKPGATFLMGVTVTPTADWIELQVSTKGPVALRGSDDRLLHCGIESIGYAAVDDMDKRQELLECLPYDTFRAVGPVGHAE